MRSCLLEVVVIRRAIRVANCDQKIGEINVSLIIVGSQLNRTGELLKSAIAVTLFEIGFA